MFLLIVMAPPFGNRHSKTSENWSLHRQDQMADAISSGLGSQRLVIIDGHTGEIKAESATPVAQDGRSPNIGNCPAITADLDGIGRRDHFSLTWGPNHQHLVAMRPDLTVRWQHTCLGGNGHGHHNAVCDIDGSGRESIYAGNEMLSPDGEVIWQEEIEKLLLCPNGGHVDSTVMGYFAGPDAAPTITMAASSAGAITCDARTGETLAVHPQGHCQSVHAGTVVPGSDEVHAIVCNRWGSYGVSGIFDPRGRRISRFQAGFTYQSARPLNWTGDGLEHLLICDGKGWRGVYDHLGNRLIDLEPFVPYGQDSHQQRYDRVNVQRLPAVANDPRDTILLQFGNRLIFLAPDSQLERGQRVFAPVRRTNVSWPGWHTIE